MEDQDEFEFIPDCEHCRDFVVLRESGINLSENKELNLKNSKKSRSLLFDLKRSKDKIVGRLIYTRNGRFFFLQDSKYIDNSSPRFLIASCEISGCFKSSRMLQCGQTEFNLVSCWMLVRDWNLLKIKTNDSSAPLRSALLDKHIHPNVHSKEYIHNVFFLREKLFCFNASTVVWLSSEQPKVFPIKIGIKNASIIGLVSHISTIVRHQIKKNFQESNNSKSEKKESKLENFESSEIVNKSRNLNLRNTYVIDKILEISEKFVYDSSFSIVVNSTIDGKEFVIFFPGAHLLIYRHTLDWKYIYKFENIIPGSVLVHRIGEEPKRRQCYIATKSTIIQTESVFKGLSNIFNEKPLLIQIEKVLGFGVFELKTNQIPIRLFLHNSSFHEVSIGCSISKGSIFWLRNFRVINMNTYNNFSIPIGIAIEPSSDWGLYNHSKFKNHRNVKETIWNNQPFHIQTIGHEFLESSIFFSNELTNGLLDSHPWDIRNFCYYHYSLYVDIFNIIGVQRSEYQVLPILIIQVISNKKTQSPIIISANREISYSDGKTIYPNFSSLNCSRNIQYKLRITHPSQTVELRSNNLISYPVNCDNSRNRFWKIATIEEWIDLISYFINTATYNSINYFTSDHTLPIEYLYYIKRNFNRDNYNSIDNRKEYLNSNIIFSLRYLFMVENIGPLFTGFYGQFLAELVIDKSMESNYWISNVSYIKTPSLPNNFDNIYPLFINSKSKIDILFNSGFSKSYFEKKIIFIKRSVIRYYKGRFSFFVNASDIICINFEKSIECSRQIIAFHKNENEGVLLFIKNKEVVNTNFGCKFYFHCIPFFESSSKFSKYYDQNNKYYFFNSSIVKIPVPSHWYIYNNSSTFILILNKPIRKEKVVLSANQEKIFIQEMNQMNLNNVEYSLQALKFPCFTFSKNFDFKSSNSYIEIKLSNSHDDSVFWPLLNELPLSFKIENSSYQDSSLPFIFEIKYWIDNIMEWLLLDKKRSLIYRFTNVARIDIMEFYPLDSSNEKNDFDHIEMISLENVKILDIKQFLGFNPQGKHSKWSILRVATHQKLNLKNEKFQDFYLSPDPPWNSGWIDIWFSEEDCRTHNIQLLFPGEIISISNIRIARIKQATPSPYSVPHDLNFIVNKLGNCLISNKSSICNQNDFVQIFSERYTNTPEILETPTRKSRVNSSIFNNGSIIFRSAIQNTVFEITNMFSNIAVQCKNSLNNNLSFNYLYFSTSSFSEITFFYEFNFAHKRCIHENKYEINHSNHKKNSFINNIFESKNELENLENRDFKKNTQCIFCLSDSFYSNYIPNTNNTPNPYIHAPYGTPITSKFISWGRNNHFAFIKFNKAYCLQNEINFIDLNTTLPNSFKKFFDNPVENLSEIDPDIVICLKGSILHIEQINANWFCLNCLKSLKELVICSCGTDHSNISKWTSLYIYLIGAIEVDSLEIGSKIFPFTMTNWNVIKLLAYFKDSNIQDQDTRKLYNHIIETANNIWNHMLDLEGQIGIKTLYCFGQENDEISPNSISLINSQKFLENKKPLGIMGNRQILSGKKILEIPNDPISNIEIEACIRFTYASEFNKVTNIYIHVLRWKLRNIKQELENKLKQIDINI